jgi:hypothetical protein
MAASTPVGNFADLIFGAIRKGCWCASDAAAEENTAIESLPRMIHQSVYRGYL